MAYRILIVNDSPAMRVLGRRVVEFSGFDSSACFEPENGQEALEVLHEEWANVILTDINMRGMDGEEFLRLLSAEGDSGGSVRSGPEYAVRLAFEGGLRGRLTLRIAAAAAQSKAAEFQGEEASALSGREVKEVVYELSHILSGSVLSRVENRGGFRPAAPEPIGWSESLRSPGAVAYAAPVRGGALEAVVEMEGPGCPVPAESAS